jgi:hypothetical protein
MAVATARAHEGGEQHQHRGRQRQRPPQAGERLADVGGVAHDGDHTELERGQGDLHRAPRQDAAPIARPVARRGEVGGRDGGFGTGEARLGGDQQGSERIVELHDDAAGGARQLVAGAAGGPGPVEGGHTGGVVAQRPLEGRLQALADHHEGRDRRHDHEQSGRGAGQGGATPGAAAASAGPVGRPQPLMA